MRIFKVISWVRLRPLMWAFLLALGLLTISYQALAIHSSPLCETSLQPFPFRVGLLKLESGYHGEFDGRSDFLGDQVVRRLSLRQREKYRVRIQDGKLRTTRALLRTGTFDEGNLGLVILDRHHNIYVVPRRLGDDFFHSSLSGGQDLLFSGRIGVASGKITYVTDGSGHYRPRAENLIYFLWFLKRQGVELSTVSLLLRYRELSAKQRDYLRKLGVDVSKISEGRMGMFHHFFDPRFP